MTSQTIQDTTILNVATYSDYFPDLPVADNDNTRPVVAQQQPARNSTTNGPDAFRNMFAILHNTDLADLNDAGVIGNNNPRDNKDWDRFNDDITTFVLKLDDARLDALYALVQAKQPERYRDGV